MLIREHDAAASDAEWQDFLSTHDFGQLVVPRPDQLPMIVPAHFVYRAPDTVLLHLARINPVFEALPHAPEVILAVIGAYTYVPVRWNAAPGTDPDYGIPTSYYGAVQLTCRATLLDGVEEKAAMLRTQLEHFQPQGEHAPVEPGDTPFGRGLKAIFGIRLTITAVRAKFKFGGNKTPEHRRLIADRLEERAQELDLEARRYLLQRLPS